MTIGDIKIQTLKLMFINGSTNIKVEDLFRLYNAPNCSNYLVNMDESINRCFSDIETKNVLPNKSYKLNLKSNINVEINLKNTIKDFRKFIRLSPDDIDYCYKDDILFIPYIYVPHKVVYSPKIKRITVETNDHMVLDITDNIACLIPYFVKSELYRDDEPNEASEARNWYEQQMESVLEDKYSTLEQLVENTFAGMNNI